MNEKMNDEQIDDMIARAVLGELSEHEHAALDAALAADHAAREDYDADVAMAAAIQRSAAEAPPAELKSRVMDAITGIAQDGVEQDDAGPPVTSVHDEPTPEHVVRPSGATVTSLASRRTRFTRSLLAAAAVITLIVGGVIVAGNRGGDSSTFEAVATAPDAELRSLEGSLTGSLRVIYSAQERAIAIDGANLPALTADQTYQLWFVDTSGAAMSAGLFRPGDDGRVTERFDDLDPTGFVVAVTVEPAGGSEAPTLPIVATA